MAVCRFCRADNLFWRPTNVFTHNPGRSIADNMLAQREATANPRPRLYHSYTTIMHTCALGDRYYTSRAAGNTEETRRIDEWLDRNPSIVPSVSLIFDAVPEPANDISFNTTFTDAYTAYNHLATGSITLTDSSIRPITDSIAAITTGDDQIIREAINGLMPGIRARGATAYATPTSPILQSLATTDFSGVIFAEAANAYESASELVEPELNANTPVRWFGRWRADVNYVAGNVVSYDQDFWIAKKSFINVRPRSSYGHWGYLSLLQYEFIIDILDTLKQNNDVIQLATVPGGRAIKL